MYQNEDSVGAAIRESGLKRNELYITTKFGGGDIEKKFKESLKKVRNFLDQPVACRSPYLQLQLSYVDLYLIHFPQVIPNGDFESAWKLFEGFKKEGLAKYVSPILRNATSNASLRSIGVSNFTVPDLEKLACVTPWHLSHWYSLSGSTFGESSVAIETLEHRFNDCEFWTDTVN